MKNPEAAEPRLQWHFHFSLPEACNSLNRRSCLSSSLYNELTFLPNLTEKLCAQAWNLSTLTPGLTMFLVTSGIVKT